MEDWKMYHNSYFVSSCGRVKNRKGKILKMFPNSVGYLRVKIGNRLVLVHRLVAICFIPNEDPEHKIFVDHIDGNKQNNRMDNLQWLTPSENTKKSYKQQKRKKKKTSVLIYNNGVFVAEVISCYMAAKYLSMYGFKPDDAKFIYLTAKGGFRKYKKFNFIFTKTLFDL